MNITAMMNAFLALNTLARYPELPPQILKLLGHTVIVTPEVLKNLHNVDHPHILAGYGKLVENELTGAVIAGDGRFLHEQMAYLYSQKGYMERAVIILVSRNRQHRFFTSNWHRRVMNIIHFTVGGGLYTFNPFRSKFVKLELEDPWKNMDDRWRDLQGYRIPVAVYPHKYSFRREYGASPGGGIDGTAIFELAKLWNMTVNIKYVIPDEYRLARSNVMLFRGQADIGMNARVAIHTTDDEDNVEFTTAVYEDAYVIALKEPTEINTVQIMSRIFGWKFWMVFFGSIIIMKRALFWLTKQKSVFTTIFSTTSSLCNRPLPKFPRTNRERLILSSGFIIGFFIVATFQGSLFHFNKTTETNKRMKTLPEVFSNYHQILTTSRFIKKYYTYFSPIANKWERPDRGAVSNELFNNNPVIILNKELQMLMGTSRLRKDLYVVDEVSSFAMTYSVNRGSPFLAPLTQFTSRVFESGLSQKWFDMTVHRLARRNATKKSTKVGHRRNPGIEAAFCILIIGLDEEKLDS